MIEARNMKTESYPLTPSERKHYRLALFGTFLYLSLFISFIAVLLAGDLGLVDYAALFGVDRFTVWVFLTEGLSVIVVLICGLIFAVSCAIGLPLATKHRRCRFWLLGPPAVVFGLAALGVVALVVYHMLNPR
jgi:hypothetical protein